MHCTENIDCTALRVTSAVHWEYRVQCNESSECSVGPQYIIVNVLCVGLLTAVSAVYWQYQYVIPPAVCLLLRVNIFVFVLISQYRELLLSRCVLLGSGIGRPGVKFTLPNWNARLTSNSVWTLNLLYAIIRLLMPFPPCTNES